MRIRISDGLFRNKTPKLKLWQNVTFGHVGFHDLSHLVCSKWTHNRF